MCDLAEDCNGELYWHVDEGNREFNKVCINEDTDEEVERLPTKVMPNGIELEVFRSYKAKTNVVKEDIFGVIYPKGTEVTISEAPNGKILSVDVKTKILIEHQGDIEDYEVYFDYSDYKTETLEAMLKRTEELENFKESILIRDEIVKRNK